MYNSTVNAYFILKCGCVLRIMENTTVNVESVSKFISDLAELDEEALCDKMQESGIEYARLLVAMGAFVDRSCGNLNKLYEMVASLELYELFDATKYTIRHVKHEYGADIVVIDKISKEARNIEIKTSVVKRKSQYKSNWLFSVNKSLVNKYNTERSHTNLVAIINAFYEKQENGVTCFIARHELQKIAQYSISGPFIALYCTKKVIESACSTVNFGSQRCKHCKEYHRIATLSEYAKQLDDRITASETKKFEYRLDYFSDDEWCNIMHKVDTNCKK